MKQSAFKTALSLLAAIAAYAPIDTHAQQLSTYCSQTQSDDCIQVDSNGFWWDSEPGTPAKKTSRKLPIKVVGKTRIVRLDNTYFCTHSSMQVSRSYLTCSANGWIFKLN